jgi:hypothetical protein
MHKLDRITSKLFDSMLMAFIDMVLAIVSFRYSHGSIRFDSFTELVVIDTAAQKFSFVDD